jgi:hypothetical protein
VRINKRGDGGKDVDHRFGCQTRNRGGTHVLYRFGEPFTQENDQPVALLGEAQLPSRVVFDDVNRHIANHELSLRAMLIQRAAENARSDSTCAGSSDGRTVSRAFATSAAVTSAASIERRIAVSAASRSSATQSAAL